MYFIRRSLIVVFTCAAAFLAVARPGSAPAAAVFYAPRAYDGGPVSRSGDLNSDGLTDIVSVKPDRVNIRFGDGSGEYDQLATTVYTCPNFTSTAMNTPFIDDFTGDNKKDIAVWIDDSGCRGSRAIMVLPGNGTGGFNAPIFTEISNFVFSPNQFASADLNGDGKPDIIVATAFSGTGDRADVLLNNGDGTFAAPVEYSFTGGQSGYNMTIGDYNNDNRPDIFYGSQSPANVMVMTNQGNGTFAAPVTAIAGTNTIVAAGKFDAGTNLDLVTVNTSGANPTLRAWLGNGGGTFTAAAQLTLSVTNSGIGRVLTGDFNNDTKQDLAIQIDDRTVIAKGVGDGTFVEDEVYGAGGGGIFTGDFNNDGWLDLGVTQAVASNGSPAGASSQFAILLNFQTGKLFAAQGFDLGNGGEEVKLADINGDGLKDLALTGDAVNGEIYIVFQRSGLGFVRTSDSQRKIAGPPSSPAGPGMSPHSIAVADLNADNKMDVVIAGQRTVGGTYNVLAAKNDGLGNFSLFSSMNLPGNVSKVVVGKFNADNIPDLAFTERIDGSSPIPAVYVALGTGNGTFAAPVGYLSNFTGNSLVAADFNGDGKDDLAVALTNNTVQILNNSGTGTFSAGSIYDLGAAVTDIGAADINGDGKMDIVAASNLSFISDSAKISVLNGAGNGTFGTAVNYPTVWLYDQKLTLNDFNGDGKTDVAVSNNSVVSVFTNNGFGSLIEPRYWAGTGGLRAITSGDFDGDGKADLVTSTAYNSLHFLSFLINISPPYVPQIRSPYDFDGDGKTDLSVFRPNGATGSEWWYLKSSNGGNFATQFGSPTDKLVAADYTGDGKADIAFWRPSTGEWFVLRSEDSTFYAFPFGATGDVPAPADFDGDGKADAAVFRPSTSTWYIQNSGGGTTIQAFGSAGDVPVAADYDGDGKADLAIFRPNGTTGSEWWILRSTAGLIAMQFGTPTDKTVPGDYTGDGKTDVAIWRPSNGQWYILRSEDLSFYAFPFGANGDIPVPGDYDGDGKTDAAVFRPSSSTWFAQGSTSGTIIQQFGSAGDVPVPSEFVR